MAAFFFRMQCDSNVLQNLPVGKKERQFKVMVLNSSCY